MSVANPEHPATCACSQCEYGAFLLRMAAERAPDADATTPDQPTCGDCGAPMDPGEARVFTCCEACWDRHYRALGVRKDAAEPRDQRAAGDEPDDDESYLRSLAASERTSWNECAAILSVLDRLASLEAEREQIRKDEREQCALVCESRARQLRPTEANEARKCANAIRHRTAPSALSARSSSSLEQK